MIDLDVPRLSVAVEVGELGFVSAASRRAEPRASWVAGARVGFRVDRFAELELGTLAGDPNEANHALRVGPNVFLGGVLSTFEGRVIPRIGAHVGLAYLVGAETKAFVTVTPSFGLEIPLSRRFSLGETFAYTYGIDLDKPSVTEARDAETDRKWISLTTTARLRF